MPKVLLTGFEPFAGEPINPSAEIVAALGGRTIEGHEIVGAILPCVFGAAIASLRAEIARHEPAVVVCTGQAGGRPCVTVERVAINVDDARIPDNQGQQPIDAAIVDAGPPAYFASLPLKSTVRALALAGIPADVSQTAGTFVCNHVFYGLMHALAGTSVRGGFVHVPFLPEQAKRAGPGAPSMPLAVMVRAIEIVIATSLTETRDAKVSYGATH